MKRLRAPEEVRSLAAGSKPLAWARAGGGWVVATAETLTLPGREAIGWIDVIRASWDDPVLELQLPDGAWRLLLEEPGKVPRVVNERVKASVVIQHHVVLRDDKGVRLVARRTPGGTDVTWRVTFDAGLDSEDPELRLAANRALTELRASIGL